MLAETSDQREQRELVEFIGSRGGIVTLRDVIRCHWPLKDQREKAEQMLGATCENRTREMGGITAARARQADSRSPAITKLDIDENTPATGKTANCVDVEERNASKITSAGDSNFDPALDDLDAFLPADIADVVI